MNLDIGMDIDKDTDMYKDTEIDKDMDMEMNMDMDVHRKIIRFITKKFRFDQNHFFIASESELRCLIASSLQTICGFIAQNLRIFFIMVIFIN